MGIIVQDNGKLRRSEDVVVAEKVTELRKNRDSWQVIDELIKLWAKYAPDEEQAVKVNIKEYKEMQHDKKFAQTLQGKQMDRRFIVAFPKSLMLMIRTQYKADELPMDSKFFHEFARRYPAFQIPEKL